YNTAGLKPAAGLPPQDTQLPPSIGRGAAPVGCPPRQRYEAARAARPSTAAGTRRRQGRGEANHGDQRAHPACLPGSASSARQKESNEHADRKQLLPTLDIGSHIYAALQAREIAGARYERTLFPVALQALVRCFSRAEEEIRWDAQVYSKLRNLWE